MNRRNLSEDYWETDIQPKSGMFEINLKELLQYRDLLLMFVKRDIITVYKQTILGPIWYVVQPILTTAIFIIVFGNIAKISTDGMPQVIFYFSGIVIWNYFAESFITTSDTFKVNEAIFGKVYFPRLVVPLSKIVSGLIKFGIQFVFFLIIYSYFIITGSDIQPNIHLLILPFLVVLMAGLGLGWGMIFSSLTAKYRDLIFLTQFGVQLLMYASPIIYPVSTIPDKYQLLILSNPISPIVEAFRFSLLGVGFFQLEFSCIQYDIHIDIIDCWGCDL